MRLKLDREKCVQCGLCLEACPQIKENKDYRIFSCTCEEDLCLKACPRKAIVRIGDVLAIDKSLCDNCGECVKACPTGAILKQNDFPAKCDLCTEESTIRCMAACPYNAIILELSEKEKAELVRSTGWRKSRVKAEKTLRTGAEREIVESRGKKFYVTSIKELSYDEARLADWVLKALRQENERFDRVIVESLIDEYCEANSTSVSEAQCEHLLRVIESETTGYSILDVLLHDEELEEVAVLEAESPVMVYHKDFGWLQTDVMFSSEKKVIDLVNRMARGLGRRITMQKPRLNANIPLGRLHAAMPPISKPCITIRKFNKQPFTPQQLVANRTVTAEAMAFLWTAVQCDVNVIVAGNTGSGKTSTINSLLCFVPLDERVILVEETPEIVVPHEHRVNLWVDENVGVGMHELVTDTLRMRPDRVIVGEVRDTSEAKALMNCMLAGQGKGSFATFHAGSGGECLARLQSLGVSRTDLQAIDLIVIQRRWTDFKRGKDVRRVSEISTVADGSVKQLFAGNWLQRKKADCRLIDKMCVSLGTDEKGLETEVRRRAEFLEKPNDSFASAVKEINKFMS